MKKVLIFTILSILSYSVVAQLPAVPVVSGSSYSSAAGTDGVYAVVSDANGNLYIGGDFTTVGGNSRKGIAKINSDGTISSWNPLNALSNVVIYSMTIYNNKLFIGGGSTVTGGVFAAFDISTSTPSQIMGAWNLSFNGAIDELYAASNDRLYVAGGFTIVNNGSNVNRNNFATFDLTATSISNVLITSGFLPTFDYLGHGSFEYDAVNNTLYVGGEFTTVNGVSKSGVVGLNASNGSLTSFSHSFAKNGANPFYINDIKIYNNNLYVAGSFINVDAQATAIKNVASFTLSTGALRNWNINLTSSPTVTGVAALEFSGDNVVLGGSFSSINNTTRTNFAVVSATDASLKTFNDDVTNSNSNAIVNSFSNVVNNEIILAGTFTNGLDKTSLIVKTTPTITWTNPSDIYQGTALSTTQLNATASVAGSFTYTPAIGTVLSVGNNQNLKVDFTPTNTALYNSTSKTVQINVLAKLNQTITFNTLANKTYGDVDFNLTATASSGLTVTYTSSNTSVATISGNTVHIIGVGSTDITASQIGNGVYNAATNVVQTLTVNKQNQTITFNTLANKTYGDADFIPGATASSGLTVTYASSNTSVATIVSGKIHIVGVGSTNITASQIGNGVYNAATDVIQSLTVVKATPIITWSNPSDIVEGTALSATQLNATASVAGSISYNPVSGTVLNVGNNQALQANFTPTNAALYNTASKTVFINVTPASKIDQTITFDDISDRLMTDALTFTLNATSTSGLTVTYSSSDTNVEISGNLVTVLGDGFVTITASQAGNASYNAAANVEKSFNIYKASQDITFTIPETGKVGETYTLNAIVDTNLPITYESNNTSVATVSGNTLTLVGVGNVTISAIQIGNATYYEAKSDQDMTVEAAPIVKQSQDITFTALPTTNHVGDVITLSATTTSGLSIVFESSDPTIAEVNGNILILKKAGDVTISAVQSGNEFYYSAKSEQDITVEKLNQTISFNALNNVNVGDADFSPGATATSGLTVTYTSSNTNVATIVNNQIHIIGAGSTEITASQNGDDTYNAATNVIQTLTVEEKLITAVVDAEMPKLSAYPNPTTDYINIETASSKMKQIAIYSTSGNVVAQMTTADQMVQIDVASFQTGMYIVKIGDQDNSATLKFIKK